MGALSGGLGAPTLDPKSRLLPVAVPANIPPVMNARVCWAIFILLSFAGCVGSPDNRAAQPRTPYTRPLLSPGAAFATLPPPVQNAVRAQAGIQEIAHITKDTSSGQVVYKIYFSSSEVFPPLYVAADGSVLHPDLRVAVAAPESSTGAGLRLADLPPDVLKVVHDRAPDSEIASITKQPWGDRSVYILAFKDDAQHPKLYVTSDGAVFSELPK